MNYVTYYIIMGVIALLGFIAYLIFKRNYWNKHKYIRLVQYKDDMTIKITYIKHEDFNTDKSILVNPKHVYNFKGYTSIIITSNSRESINPIDFQSKYSAEKFKTAMQSKLIQETFVTLNKDKFDKIMTLLLLNVIQLLAIVYLLYSGMNGSVISG